MDRDEVRLRGDRRGPDPANIAMRPANSMPPAACPIACGSCKGARSPCRCPTQSFDRAYSHNVVMNIADKARVYREAFRVLKPGGRLVLFHVNAGPNAPVEFFPVGWASVPENSFLATNEETRRDLAAAGFDILTFRDVAVAPERGGSGAAQTGDRGLAAPRSACRPAGGRSADADQQHARPRRWAGLRGADRCQKTRRESAPRPQAREIGARRQVRCRLSSRRLPRCKPRDGRSTHPGSSRAYPSDARQKASSRPDRVQTVHSFSRMNRDRRSVRRD